MCLNCGALYERKGETWQPVTLQAIDQENRDIDNVVILDVETSLDLPLERVLDGALAAQLTDCLVLGYSADGFYMARVFAIASSSPQNTTLARRRQRRQNGARRML